VFDKFISDNGFICDIAWKIWYSRTGLRWQYDAFASYPG